ncbi:MAG: glycoside hydrolase family 92 protein, partial [Paraglaciecola sp.]|nr:glycoside hydrolase family 92 protein [Paraglaciecola sp.]
SDGERVDGMIKSLLAFFDETGLLPTWDLMANDTDVMIGYHAVPVIVDAYFKGLTDADPEKLFAAVKASAMQNQFGIDYFRQYGFIPSELEIEAVSKTLEYAFDDAAIAALAKDLGKTEEFEYFSQRAKAYKKMFDKSTGLMRGKDQEGNWVKNFRPTYVDHRNTDYTEANAWQYTWFVPHDVPGLIKLFGGNEAFVEQLDRLFSMSSEMEGSVVSPDISGLIGQYAHGNEPVHHVPYMYSYAGQKWKGEKRIIEIRDTMYRNHVDGLAGNDDVGQMSAWYVFCAMGFYPMNPYSGEYVFGTPEFQQLDIQLDNGKVFSVKMQGERTAATPYVKQIRLNGKVTTLLSLSHKDLLAGGELIFEF